MSELTTLKGIGEKTAAAFNRLGIFSAEDLIYYYPRDYERFNEPSPIYELTPGSTMAVEGVLNSDASVNRYNGRVIVNAYISDMTGRLQLSWFNSPFLKNSLKAGRHLVFRGRISEKNGRLNFHIQNTGSEIDSESLKYIFERFYKSDRSRGSNPNGSGLGLYIVKTIIGRHGGDVYAKSGDGKTEFYFNIPIS